MKNLALKSCASLWCLKANYLNSGNLTLYFGDTTYFFSDTQIVNQWVSFFVIISLLAMDNEDSRVAASAEQYIKVHEQNDLYAHEPFRELNIFTNT